MFLAQKFFVTSGFGVDEYVIASFDKALVMAGLEDYNLVRVSSIIPPNTTQSLQIDSPKGSVLFTAYTTICTKSDELIASSIVAAIPKDRTRAGVIMEYSCIGDKNQAMSIAKKLATDALCRRKISEYDLIVDGIEARGEWGLVTTTFCAIALL